MVSGAGPGEVQGADWGVLPSAYRWDLIRARGPQDATIRRTAPRRRFPTAIPPPLKHRR